MENPFELYAEDYDQWFVQNESTYLTELRALRKVIPTAEKGLEVGVGTGRFALPFSISVGIDPSPAMLTIAARRGISVVLGMGETLPFRNEEFDYVLMVTTLCFVNDPRQVMREARRVTKKGGKLIIGMIDKVSPLGEFYERKDSSFYGEAKFFSTRKVMNLLKSNDFGDFVAYQTIFRAPSELRAIDEIKEGCGEGSFVVIGGKRKE